MILSADWSISRLQSWTCSSLPACRWICKTYTEYYYRNSAIVRRLVQSPTLQSTIFCGVHSDLRGKGIRVSPAWYNLMLIKWSSQFSSTLCQLSWNLYALFMLHKMKLINWMNQNYVLNECDPLFWKRLFLYLKTLYSQQPVGITYVSEVERPLQADFLLIVVWR